MAEKGKKKETELIVKLGQLPRPAQINLRVSKELKKFLYDESLLTGKGGANVGGLVNRVLIEYMARTKAKRSHPK